MFLANEASPDDAVPPPIPAACPPGLTLIDDVCVELPLIPVPEQPVEEAETPTPPPLDETIAGAAGEGDALGPTEVALPTEGAFDAEACALGEIGVRERVLAPAGPGCVRGLRRPARTSGIATALG